MLGVIKYHQINHNFFEDSKLHPESQKKLEELHYKVEHNLPVTKELLFQMVPELFRFEINKLQVKDRLMYKTDTKAFAQADGSILEQDLIDNQKLIPDAEDIHAKLMRMDHYILEQKMDMYKLYYPKMEAYFTRNNYANIEAYMQQLMIMDEEKMLPWEREFMKELYELKGIEEDMAALSIKAVEEQWNTIYIDHWIKNPELKQWIIDEYKYMFKYKMVDERDTILIPPPPNDGPTFDERLRLATGGKIDDLIDQERHEFKKLADERIPPSQFGVNDKDATLLQKVNVIAQAVVVEQPPSLTHDNDDFNQQIIDQHMYEEISQDHRILRDEIYRVLLLNNQNPELYNVEFWSKHFKIEPAAIRNIFNYIAYPVPDPKTQSIKQVLYFIDIDMVRNADKITDLTREDYIGYLEEDYYRRIERDATEMNEALGGNRSMRQLFIEEPMIQPGMNQIERLKITQVSKILDCTVFRVACLHQYRRK